MKLLTSLYFAQITPADTLYPPPQKKKKKRRNNDVATTSKRRHSNVKMTSFWRNNDVISA